MTQGILIDVPPTAPHQINVPFEFMAHIVVSFYAPDRRWKVWPDQWTSEKAAQDFCARLPTGHTHAAIFHLRTEAMK